MIAVVMGRPKYYISYNSIDKATFFWTVIAANYLLHEQLNFIMDTVLIK